MRQNSLHILAITELDSIVSFSRHMAITYIDSKLYIGLSGRNFIGIYPKIITLNQFKSIKTSIVSDNGLLPDQRQAITRINAGILVSRPLATDISNIWIKI